MKSFYLSAVVTTLLAASAVAVPQLASPGMNDKQHEYTRLFNSRTDFGGAPSLCCITKEDFRKYGQNNAAKQCTFDECA
ncbi:hypothetical protein HIM_03820 [Hirsutella minnesotensis 3608]|uniref:Uncharacterized protein n=1 Tax=Hirsutella minnesotensis 3608 TaxID=1043627 RepID=A0A0F7ZVN9_9HYPO|nr:hypothetical protein HIM_03820 [Hirsutella minnesotensis 3608]